MEYSQFIILSIILTIIKGENLVGYNCGIGSPNITTVSLLKVEECESEEIQPQVISLNLQLLQIIDHEPVVIHQCRVKIEEHIRYCGMHSHVSEVADGESTYGLYISKDTCQDIIQYGKLQFKSLIIDQIVVNATTKRSLVLAGTIEKNGYCSGAAYLSGKTQYKDVIVTAKLEISVFEYVAVANYDKNEIVLNTGTRCPYKQGKCIDINENYAFWNVRQSSICKFENYAILYEGMGVKVSDSSSSQPSIDVYFGNSTGDIKFGLSKTGERMVCGYKIMETEHPKLFITEYLPNQGFATKRYIETHDIILTAYFNTKIAYLQKHIKSQFESMYRDVVLNRCKLERQIIINSINYLYTRPDLFALTIMKEPGHMAIPAGEVAHIIPCESIICKIRHEQNCYQEIPVECGKENYFMKPQTRIITKSGTPRDCNTLLPTMFYITSNWIQFLPTTVKAETPQIIKPLSKPTWKYTDLEGLINSGIYSTSDLERLREHMIFPAEKPAYIESLIRKLSNRHAPDEKLNYQNLFDSNLLTKMARKAWEKLWDGFTKFGIYSAGFITIIMIIQLLKVIIDTIIQGYALYTVYGWGIHLIGAFWSSITNLIFHLKQPIVKDPNSSLEQGNKGLEKPTAPKEDRREENLQIKSEGTNFRDLEYRLHNMTKQEL